MADLERNYVIPLRKGFLKVPIYKRTKRAISEVRKFIIRHMKVEEVKICANLNHFLWAKGCTNPPTRIKIKTRKEGTYALVELQDYDFPKKKEEVKETKIEKALNDKDVEGKKEEKLLKNEPEKKENLAPGPEKKEELKTKQIEERLKKEKIVNKSQKRMIKHEKQNKSFIKTSH
ncbi:MAG: 50S ribosomal protein L31e [Candidatus Nanoarchaeia archaeon]|nr:50S ribosomal protein L31e [Candidatus Nanoarchaeia archaeon]MDD5587694.1 50S ribosomal protein L31e [Candidatus Nanoarchaeia archaeon]